jgi:hypothetical protein
VRSATRLFALLARNAPVGVIFRRGPSRQVLLIEWNTDTDDFRIGQWLKGRIYERRCDLSPNGDLLLYFAASYRKPFYSWSAISRPPYFTALTLWPKGDGWGGGGLFHDGDQILLNHRDDEMAIAGGFTTPDWLSIKQFGDRPGWGEDEPIWSDRLRRDGWKLIAYPERTKNEWGAKVGVEFDPPLTMERDHPIWPGKYALRMSVLGLNERNGPWYSVEHSLIRMAGSVDPIGKSDWADWAPNGDLLFAQSGCLFRLRHKGKVLKAVEESDQIADFSNLKFEEKPPTSEAPIWPTRKKLVRRLKNKR